MKSTLKKKAISSEDFQAVLEQLKSILQNFEARLLLKVDKPGSYSLDAPYSEKYKKSFSSARRRSRKTM